MRNRAKIIAIIKDYAIPSDPYVVLTDHVEDTGGARVGERERGYREDRFSAPSRKRDFIYNAANNSRNFPAVLHTCLIHLAFLLGISISRGSEMTQAS